MKLILCNKTRHTPETASSVKTDWSDTDTTVSVFLLSDFKSNACFVSQHKSNIYPRVSELRIPPGFVTARGKWEYVWLEAETFDTDCEDRSRQSESENYGGWLPVAGNDCYPLWLDNATWFIGQKPTWWFNSKEIRQMRGWRIMGNISEGVEGGIGEQTWLRFLSGWECRNLHTNPMSKIRVWAVWWEN